MRAPLAEDEVERIAALQTRLIDDLLAVARRGDEGHDLDLGEIDLAELAHLESKPGVGTTVRLTLPRP